MNKEQRPQLGLKSVFADELSKLDDIAKNERSLLDQLSSRMKPPSLNMHRSADRTAKPSNSNSNAIKMPSMRREEVADSKRAMLEYQEQKEQKMFIKRRTKLIRNHWRNGIAGVEDMGETSLS